MKITTKFLSLLTCCVLLVSAPGLASAGPQNDTLVTAKVFPFLRMLERDPGLAALVRKDKSLSKIHSEYLQRIQKGASSCENVNCYAEALKWTEGEVAKAGDVLIQLYQGNKSFHGQIASLRKKGSYALFDKLPDTAFLRKAWNQDAAGVNRIFAVYISGQKPRYFKIDSISFKTGDPEFKKQLQTVLGKSKSANGTFVSFPLFAAVQTLKINGRQEMIQYEPLNGGMNEAPYKKIAGTDFSKYKYSIILVPGLGPEIPGQRLDPNGAKRCAEAAKRFHAGLAPFLVVSGGNVHPFKTPYNEAEEMKKYMVEELKIPADVIFIEPHARHTTTNMRNLNRMVYRFGIPADKPVLIVTDENQSKYIVERMEKTAIRDLGYVPYQKLKKLTETETEYYPNFESLQVDSIDPLDP